MARRSRDFPLFSGPPYSSTIKTTISEVQGASGAGGEKTIAAHHEAHPNQVTASKAQVLENLPGLFGGSRTPSGREARTSLTGYFAFYNGRRVHESAELCHARLGVLWHACGDYTGGCLRKRS